LNLGTAGGFAVAKTLLATGNAGWRTGGSAEKNLIRFDLAESEILHCRWLSRREGEENADPAFRAGQVELPAQPILRSDRPSRAALAGVCSQNQTCMAERLQ
jgi:hypothetical protein